MTAIEKDEIRFRVARCIAKDELNSRRSFFNAEESMDRLKGADLEDARCLLRMIVREVEAHNTAIRTKITLFDNLRYSSKWLSSKLFSGLNIPYRKIDELIKSPALDGLVGPSAFKILSRISLRSLTGEAQEFAAGVKQLTAQETLDELLNLKKAGGTLGALSDTERVMLQNAATKLGTWEIKDKNGMGTGRWNVSEGAFRRELETIKNLAQTAIKEAQGGEDFSVQNLKDSFDSFWQSASDSDLPQIENMLNDPKLGATEEERKGAILEYFGQSGGFSSVAPDTDSGNIKLGSRLARVNNNPGNLRFVGQAGATQGDGGFARFSTPEAGYNALKNQIKLDASRGLTLVKFINKYAPPSENDTGLYVKQMMKELGVSENTKISLIDLNKLARAIAKKESSTIIG